MADTKISAMPAATTLTGSEIVPLVQTNANVQTTTGLLVNQTIAAAPSTTRTALGLGTMALQNANAVNISGGAVVGITDLLVADGGTGASAYTAGYLKANGTNPFTTVSTIPYSDITSQQYAEIYVTGGSTSQTTSATPNSYTQLTSFTTNGNANGATPVAASDKITVNQTGVYQVTMTMTFTATNNHTFAFRVYNNTTATAYANTNVKNHTTSTNPHSLSITALISTTASDDLIVQVTSADASQIFTVTDANFAIIKIG
jgi:hypothetical protein